MNEQETVERKIATLERAVQICRDYLAILKADAADASLVPAPAAIAKRAYAKRHKREDTRRAIVDFLRGKAWPQMTKDIVDHLGYAGSGVESALASLRRGGTLTRGPGKYGKYMLAPPRVTKRGPKARVLPIVVNKIMAELKVGEATASQLRDRCTLSKDQVYRGLGNLLLSGRVVLKNGVYRLRSADGGNSSHPVNAGITHSEAQP